MAFSFGTSGSTPNNFLSGFNQNAGSNPFLGSYGGTPASKALSSATSPSAPRVGVSSLSSLQSAGLVSPSTAPKSVTHNNVDGSSSTVTYHAPTPVDTSSFTPEQKKAFDTANSLGSGVQTTQPSQQSSQNYTTPSGAVVNTQGGLISGPSQQPPNKQTSQQPLASAPVSQPPTYPGLLEALQKLSTEGSPQVQEANKNLADFRTKLAGTYAGIENTPIPLEFQQGREQVVGRQAATEEAALQSAVSNALTGQNQQITGLTAAMGGAAPQLAGYNQQAFNPLTGGFSGGGSMNDAITNVTQQLQSGQIGFEDAKAQLSGYGQAGLNALSDWATKNNFNVAQSNALAGQQGSIKPAYDYATTALKNLQDTVGKLGVGQNTNIPIINQIAQGVSGITGIGSQEVQAYKGALAEARSAIQKVLASVQGGTPTDYVGQSNALLPDNATPNQIAAAQKTLETLGAAKVGIYGNPGQSGGSSGTAGGSIWSW